MSRRHRKPPKPKRIYGALVVVTPGRGVVERTQEAIADARALALAKREVERALVGAGVPKRQACIVVAEMRPGDLLAEAERIRAAAEPASPEPVAIPAQTRPWWRSIFGGAA